MIDEVRMEIKRQMFKAESDAESVRHAIMATKNQDRINELRPMLNRLESRRDQFMAAYKIGSK